jgi:hypothetical protein
MANSGGPGASSYAVAMSPRLDTCGPSRRRRHHHPRVFEMVPWRQQLPWAAERERLLVRTMEELPVVAADA